LLNFQSTIALKTAAVFTAHRPDRQAAIASHRPGERPGTHDRFVRCSFDPRFAGYSMELDILNCTQCEIHMLEVARPLMRIFGDVRGFQCPHCSYMILEYSKRMVHANGVGEQSPQQLDVASTTGVMGCP
jgi:hypothetical protein